MLKLILIGGVGLVSLVVALGLLVVMLEHFQHRNQQTKYDDLHRRMGLDPDSPLDEDDFDHS